MRSTKSKRTRHHAGAHGYVVYAQEQTDYPVHVDTSATFVRARTPGEAASKVRTRIAFTRRPDRVEILSVERSAKRRIGMDTMGRMRRR